MPSPCCSVSFPTVRNYFGEVSVLLGVKRTASAKSKTQCQLYRLRKTHLLALLYDYPKIEIKMTNDVQSRRRWLAHYLDPENIDRIVSGIKQK